MERRAFALGSVDEKTVSGRYGNLVAHHEQVGDRTGLRGQQDGG